MALGLFRLPLQPVARTSVAAFVQVYATKALRWSVVRVRVGLGGVGICMVVRVHASVQHQPEVQNH